MIHTEIVTTIGSLPTKGPQAITCNQIKLALEAKRLIIQEKLPISFTSNIVRCLEATD